MALIEVCCCGLVGIRASGCFVLPCTICIDPVCRRISSGAYIGVRIWGLGYRYIYIGSGLYIYIHNIIWVLN